MKGKSKAGALAIIVAVGALAYYGIAHSKMQVSGYHLLNSDSVTYTTVLKGCPGYSFPAKVVPNTDLNNAPSVTADKTAGQNCSTTYISDSSNGSQPQTCQVEVTVSNGSIASLNGTGSCKTTNGGMTLVMGAS